MSWFKRLVDLFFSSKEPMIIMDKTREIKQWLLEQEDHVELTTMALYQLAPLSNVKHGEFVPGQDGCKVIKK